jgi:hypothetical protein
MRGNCSAQHLAVTRNGPSGAGTHALGFLWKKTDRLNGPSRIECRVSPSVRTLALRHAGRSAPAAPSSCSTAR